MNQRGFSSWRSRMVYLLASSIILTLNATAQNGAFEPIYTRAELELLTPTSPNPRLAFLPGHVTPDYDYWNSKAYWVTKDSTPSTQTPRNIMIIVEEESLLDPNDPNFVNNNSIQSAQYIEPLGTEESATVVNNVQIQATFRPGTFITTTVFEDNGAILSGSGGSATPVPTNIIGGTITSAFSTIGDGPHGSAGTGTGDFDYYSTGLLVQGDALEINVETFPGDFSNEELDPVIIIYSDRDENFDGMYDRVAVTGVSSISNTLVYFVETPGQYFISVSSYVFGFTGLESFPGSPHVSGSGNGFETEGDYVITIRAADRDFFSFDLIAGDVFSFGNLFAGSPARSASLLSPGGQLVLRTNFNFSAFDYPEDHPYRSNTPLHGAFVAPESGRYFVNLLGSNADDYTVDLKVLRPPIEQVGSNQNVYITMWGEPQFIYDDGCQCFLDFTVFSPIPVNPGDWGGIDNPNTLITPAVTFFDELFGNLEEEPADFISDTRDLLAPLIRQRVQEKMPDANVLIGPPPFFADPNSYSEIYLGGSVPEIGIDTIGIAQSIDIGNFDLSETAILLMDDLTLNIPLIPFFWIPSNDQVIDDQNRNIAYTDMVVTVISNILLHEAGHIFGNYHTDNIETNTSVNNLMDKGGPNGYFKMAGVGSDFTFNTNDDDDPQFTTDLYDPVERFVGIENTETTLSFGVGGGIPATLNLSRLHVNLDAGTNGIGSFRSPFDALQSAVDVINPSGVVSFFPSSSEEIFIGTGRISTPMILKNANPELGSIRIGKESPPPHLKMRTP